MGESVFEVVKQSVTAREVAELYGIAVGRGGMACCPFHDDRHPSMKVDTRFHCFGCGADGDVIDFTARLYDLSPKGAAEKLAQDFGLSYDSMEIPKNSKVKYELNKDTGILEMDRILYTSTHYPANYGFIPRTYADDGDPLDVLVLCSQTLHPMTLVRSYPIGVIHMIDNGQRDDKIVAIPCNDPTYNSYHNIDDLPRHIFEEIVHFFQVYKELEHKTTAVDEVEDVYAAKEIIAADIDHYIDKFCKA